MINPSQAKTFAQQWIQAWNDHDLEAIMSFYADSITHITPKLTMLFGAASDTINNKEDLRDYFQSGLKRSPELNFTLENVYAGTNSVVIVFQSTTGIHVAVSMELNDTMKITRYMAHYR